jgi:hypothetical protein
MVSLPGRIFLLSPAKAGGPRYSMLTREQADFDVARRLREGVATIGEVYSFISGLYFRGKMMYAEAFRAAPAGVPAVLVMVPGAGLVPPETIIDAGQLRAIAGISVAEDNPEFRDPCDDSRQIAGRARRKGLRLRVAGQCSERKVHYSAA